MCKTQLKTSQLGDTGLEITRVGSGARAIGGGWPRGCRRSRIATAWPRGPWRSPGRCGISQWTARSPDSVGPARSSQGCEYVYV
jgi:hypothetical protein